MTFVLWTRDANYRKRLTVPTSKNPRRKINLDKDPAPTVTAGGIGGVFHAGYHIESDGAPPPMTDASKPPYRVPLMTEIARIPWNGLTVVSTFAGCGGSSTGYRLAGYRVLLANEFVPIAQESYAANMGPHTQLAREDIKALTGPEILKRIGLKPGELDVLDGSPPCQAFSTAGQREKGWGKDREYDHGAKQRNEDLFDEYIRLVHWLKPKVFVAENVSGLVKGTAKGYFIRILAALKAAGDGYVVEAQLLDAQWLGVPQARQRIIFVGVRKDLAALGFAPAFPKPRTYRYSVRDALPWLGTARARHDTSGQFSAGDVTDRPAPTPTAHGPGHLKIIGQTDEIIVGVGDNGGFGKGGMQSPDLPAQTIGASPSTGNGNSPAGAIYVKKGRRRSAETPATIESGEATKRKFTIPELMRICAFPDDFVLKGTYYEQWERLGNSVPPVMMQAVAESIRDAVLIPARARTTGPAPRSTGRSTKARSPRGAGTRPPDAGAKAARRAPGTVPARTP